ncbi:MAG: ribose-phosphate diphosphokinase, partial [Myxococcales bacterium]|nr:ribose-phosphate diphosphokinase [Myxococcales bacterium]
MTILYTTRSYLRLASEIRGHNTQLRLESGEVDAKLFPDGERYLRLQTDPAGQDAVVLGGTISESDTLELYDLACGVVEAGARSLTLAIPYFGYSTMERAQRPHEIVTAKTRARLLSSIPVPGSGSRVLLLDLHTEGIPFYFEGALRPVHVSAQAVVVDAIRNLKPQAVACTDAGRAKWVERFANDLGLPAAFVFKRRHEQGTEVTAVSAQVQGRRVVVYDDIIRTGGSLIAAGRAYRDAGAASLAAVATHGVLPGDAAERIRASGLFDKLVVTDSHPRTAALRSDFVEVVSIAPVLS